MNDARDPPGVERRKARSGLSECKCSRCGKWSTFGMVYAEGVYVCPECCDAYEQERRKNNGTET